MTVVASDAAFRTAYGSGVFVGDRYTGALPDAGTLTLTRPDGFLADTVSYGGPGWPVPTTGQSLELLDPAADNDDGASWVLSSGAGTPGTPRSTGPVVTAPAAPVVGTATAGNTTATVTWTAPADDGGSAITGYQVRVVNGAGTQVGALRPAGAGSHLTVTGLTNGTTYRLQVAAANSAGTGPLSALSNAVTPQGAISGAVGFVGVGHSADGSKKFKSVAVPAATKVGDTMVLFETRGTADGWTDPTGIASWTQVSSVSGSSKTSTVWVKRATASDLGSTITITNAAYKKALLGLGVYSGVAATSPVRAVSSATDSSRASHTSPTVTAGSGDWVLTYYVDFSSTTTSWSSPGGTTTRDSSTQTGSGRYASLWVDSGAPVPGGSYGGLTASSNAASSRAFAWTMALQSG